MTSERVLPRTTTPERRTGAFPAVPPATGTRRPTGPPARSLPPVALIGAAVLLGVQAMLIFGRGWTVFAAGAQADERFGQAALSTVDRDAPIGTLLLLGGIVVAVVAVLLIRRFQAAWVAAAALQGLLLVDAAVEASAAPLRAAATALLAIVVVPLLMNQRTRRWLRRPTVGSPERRSRPRSL